MQELSLLLLVLAAVSAGTEAKSEEGCRATGKDRGEIVVCGDTREIEASTLGEAMSPSAPPRTKIVPANLPADGQASGSKALGPVDRENVPKGRNY